MRNLPTDELPMVQRLALAYAPTSARQAVMALLLLDTRLSGILRQRGDDAIIAQMKLAWWRDRLGEGRANWPSGEPLLQRLVRFPAPSPTLVPLVDGWEALLAEELTPEVADEFAIGRVRAWQALAKGAAETHVEWAARQWALADLALHLGNEEERERVVDLIEEAPDNRERLPHLLRPLAVLCGLSLRALERGSPEALDGPGATLAALRIGLAGR